MLLGLFPSCHNVMKMRPCYFLKWGRTQNYWQMIEVISNYVTLCQLVGYQSFQAQSGNVPEFCIIVYQKTLASDSAPSLIPVIDISSGCTQNRCHTSSYPLVICDMPQTIKISLIEDTYVHFLPLHYVLPCKEKNNQCDASHHDTSITASELTLFWICNRSYYGIHIAVLGITKERIKLLFGCNLTSKMPYNLNSEQVWMATLFSCQKFVMTKRSIKFTYEILYGHNQSNKIL